MVLKWGRRAEAQPGAGKQSRRASPTTLLQNRPACKASPDMADPRRSYSTQQVARRLGVSIQTVQRWADAGHLKAWKTLGGHRRIDAESAESLFRAEREALGETAPPPPLRVLVVDDNADDREIVARLVRQALPQAQVTLAENGFEGLVAVGQLDPQILITDVLMPHMDGFEMLRHLAMHSAVKPRHIIAMSSHGAEELGRRDQLPTGIRLVAKPVESKPFVEWLQAAAKPQTSTAGV
jgi:excisionase family DNA binding protein